MKDNGLKGNPVHKKWIDISVTIQQGMVHWPGDPAIGIKRVLSIEQGDDCNVSRLSIGSHTGTHMDAPLHFLRKGKGLDKMPVDAAIGPVRVIEISDRESIKANELKQHRIRAGERILFKTHNSRYWKSNRFRKDFIYIAHDAAEYLAKKKIRTVGIDYLSVGGFYHDGTETHQALLRAGIWVIEGLNLLKVEQGRYHLVCLPIKVLNADGAPARAVLYSSGWR